MIINSFDLEYSWMTLPQRGATCLKLSDTASEINVLCNYLDFLDEIEVKNTFFVVGLFAKLNPNVIREIVKRGHEVAAHSYFHDDHTDFNVDRFRKEVRAAKLILEDVSSTKVLGYRTPAFTFPKSISKADFYKILSQEGYLYDSSIFNGFRVDSNRPTNSITQPVKYLIDEFEIYELPFFSSDFFGLKFPALGGGYLRLVPPILLPFIKSNYFYKMTYLHIKDIKRKHPKELTFSEKIRYKINIGNIHSKVRRINFKNKTYTIKKFIETHQSALKSELLS